MRLRRKWRFDLAQLLLRFVMSYGFYSPFMVKIQHVEAFARWLTRMHFTAPMINAWFVILLQGTAIICLILGLATRPLAILLLFHMLIGLLAVHWPNGFNARNNGYEIPLYYALILLSLVIYGPGRWSIDSWLRGRLLRS